MKSRIILGIVALGAAVAGVVLMTGPYGRSSKPKQEQQEPPPVETARQPEPERQPQRADPSPPPPKTRAATEPARVQGLAENPVASTNKLERLNQVRETFRALAAGPASAALQAAKAVTNENEREMALLTLVTEWNKGELSSPRERAFRIGRYGSEAGLGMELAKNPEMAVQWANELTEGAGRLVVFQQAAMAMLDSNPASAFGLSEQLPEGDRRKFYDSVFAGWGGKDTEAALQWADSFGDGAEKDAAIQAIRTSAPVGIGAALAMKDGYAVIDNLVPGTPAESSGQIRRGDRILALAQGNDGFVDAHNVPLQDLVSMIRGQPGTTLRLQVASADAAPGSPPRTVSIVRDQIKFKR